uniref:Uncharacterized protein n=1 Tax=Micrurus lemniscatus lemniscatus TaxID=129467 RepID=A0A2D4HRC8_MICLE
MSFSSPAIKKEVGMHPLSQLDVIRKVWNNVGGALVAPLNLSFFFFLHARAPGALAAEKGQGWSRKKSVDFVRPLPRAKQNKIKPPATSTANSFNKHCFLL